MPTITELIVLLIMVIVVLLFLYGVLWGIEKYIAPIPQGFKVGLALIVFLLIVLVVIGAFTGTVRAPRLL